jgi:uncharacterized OB-fold protein
MQAQRGRAHESFVAGLEAGTVLLPKCSDCKRTFFYPRLHCPRCFGRAIELKPLGEELRVRSFAWVWRPQSPAPIESLPVLMVVVGSDDLSLIAEGRGWSEAEPPVVGEVVELGVETRSTNEAIAVAIRCASA